MFTYLEYLSPHIISVVARFFLRVMFFYCFKYIYVSIQWEKVRFMIYTEWCCYKNNERNIHIIKKPNLPSRLLPHWRHGNSFTWAHDVRFMNHFLPLYYACCSCSNLSTHWFLYTNNLYFQRVAIPPGVVTTGRVNWIS